MTDRELYGDDVVYVPTPQTRAEALEAERNWKYPPIPKNWTTGDLMAGGRMVFSGGTSREDMIETQARAKFPWCFPDPPPRFPAIDLFPRVTAARRRATEVRGRVVGAVRLLRRGSCCDWCGR